MADTRSHTNAKACEHGVPLDGHCEQCCSQCQADIAEMMNSGDSYCKDGCVLMGQHDKCRAECSACKGKGYTLEHDFQSDCYGREHSVMREMGCNVCESSGSVPLSDDLVTPEAK